MTDCAIVRILLKDNFKDAFENLEKNGGILHLNNTINKWFLSIFIQGISNIYSNFIWDMFLLEGNIIIFKAIYAIIIILQKQLKKYKSFEDLNTILNNMPLEFNNREKLAFYLIGKKFNFNMDIIKKYRKALSLQIIKEISSLGTFKNYEDDDEDEEDKNKKKEIICDLDWPQCLKEKKNLEKEYDYVVLKELDEPNVIEDFIDYYNEYKDGSKKIERKYKNMNFYNDDDIESQKIKYFKEERFKDILIERKKHYCGSNIMSIRSCFYKSEINKNNKENEENKDNYQIKKIRSFCNEIDKKENINERDRRIDRIVTHVSKGNQNKISFIKENVEKHILLDDEKDE